MIKLSMNENRRDAIERMPLLEYADDDHNFINNVDYLNLRNALLKTLQEIGPLILATAKQAEQLANYAASVRDAAQDNLEFDSDGYYRRKYSTHRRIVDAIIRESKKAGWKVSGGVVDTYTIEEDK
jgi:hypothetical protein